MKLYEYQAKELFRGYGITTPHGHVLKSPVELKAVLSRVSYPVVVKAQVLVGGRGKAGGVKFADTPEELEKSGTALLGATLKDEKVTALLLEEKVPATEETTWR